MKAKIYNLIVLDKSGSMHSIADLAIGGVNETIGTIKSDNKQNAENTEQFVSLYAFCRCDSRYIMQNVPAEEATVIDTKDYMPCCGTPLYDSLGKSLNDLYNLIKEDKNATASVTIITDGYENSSTEYDHAAIKSLIERLKGEGWLFAYIGADHDVESVSISLSIDHHMKFEKSHKSTSEMFARERSSRSRWSKRISDEFALNPCCFRDSLVDINSDDYWAFDTPFDGNKNDSKNEAPQEDQSEGKN